MSDKPTTYSWQVESKAGASTRVDGVADVYADGDKFELADETGATIFVAPFASLAYAKRTEPRGMNATDGVTVTAPKGQDPVEFAKAVMREIEHLRAK